MITGSMVQLSCTPLESSLLSNALHLYASPLYPVEQSELRSRHNLTPPRVAPTLPIRRMLMRGRARHLVPCTPLGCLELLSRSGIDVRGKSCVVVGDSNVVGTPLAVMLRDHGAAAVTVCHRISYKE